MRRPGSPALSPSPLLRLGREKPPADSSIVSRKGTPHMTTRFRTWVLIVGLSALFVSLGAFVGGTGGLVLFLLLAVGFNFAMYWFSDRIALKVSRAQPLERSAAPEIYADVEDLAQRAGLPVPRLYVIPSEQPNAFAT